MMAVWTVVETNRLASGFVLAPERYHPGRELSLGVRAAPLVADLARHARDVVTPERTAREVKRFRLLDTSDAFEGVVSGHVRVVSGDQVKSAKKELRAGDVIVSRLRPYLKQVAYVDAALFKDGEGGECAVVCSTEFLVLRSATEGSIAFLVPFLLTPAVQSVFAAAVEGGHHPRFAAAVLMGLPVPQELVDDRQSVSREVEKAVGLSRESEEALQELRQAIHEKLVKSIIDN